MLQAWCEATLVVPTGPLQGEPLRLEDWQLSWLEAAMRPGVFEAGLSVSRKNGKSALVAVVLLAHLCGPLASRSWRGLVASVDLRASRELQLQIQQMAELAELEVFTYRSSPYRTIYEEHDTRVDFLAADRGSGHAAGADLAIIDEAGLLEEGDRELWDAVRTATSGRAGKFWCIGIRSRGPMFEELRERADSLDSTHFTAYEAPPGCRLDDREAWKSANPGLGSIKPLTSLEAEAAAALSTPAQEPGFRRLHLNQAIAEVGQPLVTVEDWEAIEAESLPERAGGCVVGLDLGGAQSMTAAVVIWPQTGRMEVLGAFAGEPGLRTRARRDREAGHVYEAMRDEGELVVCGHRTVDVVGFLSELVDRLQGEEVFAVGCDRFRKADLEQAMLAGGLSWPVELRGTGASATADGSADVRAFQRLVLDQRIQVNRSTLWRHALRNTQLRFDSAGNPALDRREQRRANDAAAAGVIAAGLAMRVLAAPPVEDDAVVF